MLNLTKIKFKDFVTLQRGFDLPRKDMNEGPYPVIGSNYSIRYAALYRKDQEDKWVDSIKEEFEKRLNREYEPTLEFSVIVGAYFQTLYYLNKNWAIEKINQIFPKEQESHWKAAFEGYRGIGRVMHAYHEKPATRLRLLRCVVEKEASVVVVALNKRKVYTKLQEEKAVLYNYVTNILLDRIFTKKLIPVEGAIELIASKRETNKFLNENFKDYLQRQAISNHGVELTVSIKTPSEEKALQAVDFVSWGIFRKYEYGDEDYYKVMKSAIVEENPLFP